VCAIEVDEEPADWRGFAQTWVREHRLPGKVAMLVAGPSPKNPDASHRLEFFPAA
jgi:pyruvate kinase